MDTSANHSGMSGCLLGVDALYDQLNHDPIPLAELEKAEIHESKGGYIRLTYKGGGTIEEKCYQGQYICAVLNAIAEIAAAEREKNPQKPKRKVGKPLGKVKYSVEVFGFASGAVKRNRNKSGFASAKYMTVSRSNAAKYIAPGMDEGDGRIIMDTTLTHSGKQGYLFSADALYSHQWKQPVLLEGLKKAELCGKDNVRLTYEDGKTMEVRCHYDPEYICGVLAYPAVAMDKLKRILSDADEAYEQGMYETTLELYLKAAELGEASAQTRCGEMYIQSTGTEKNKEKAFRWFSRAAAQDNSMAQLYMGRMMCRGEGTEKDELKGIMQIIKSADFGNPLAQYEPGYMYLHGRWSKKDTASAFSYAKQAAQHGYSKAMRMLGNMYYSGRGIDADFDKAMMWYKKAEETSDEFELIDGMADNMEKERSAWADDAQKAFDKKDYESALDIWLDFAAEGDRETQFMCGEIYYKGLGTSEDPARALYWYEKSADQGHTDAMHQCAIIYMFGNGVEKDKEKSTYWFDRYANTKIRS